MSIEHILIVDDEKIVREFIQQSLNKQGYSVEVEKSAQDAIARLEKEHFDLIVSDLKMPGMSGLELLKTVKKKWPETLFLLITAYGSIDTAVEAMRLGAFDFIVKPFSPDALDAILEKAKKQAHLTAHNSYLREQIFSGGRPGKKRIIGESPQMKKILADVAKAAASNANIMVTGESGSGKEVIAKLVHSHSPRSQHPYIKLNCAAVPETLMESEFFGHEKGAFTGASNKRLGYFELAHTGTLLLDEITEIPLSLQAKLLRVVQEQELERIGSSKSIQIDVRIVSTTNRNIKEAVTEKILREDLFYRLNVVPIHIPPLRERKEDILPLAEYFLELFCLENNKKKKKLTPQAQKKLLSYPWPGNVRELANIIERVVVMVSATEIEPDHLYLDGVQHVENLGLSLRDLEKQYIEKTLETMNQNTQETAKMLGITPKELLIKLKNLKILKE